MLLCLHIAVVLTQCCCAYTMLLCLHNVVDVFTQCCCVYTMLLCLQNAVNVVDVFTQCCSCVNKVLLLCLNNGVVSTQCCCCVYTILLLLCLHNVIVVVLTQCYCMMIGTALVWPEGLAFWYFCSFLLSYKSLQLSGTYGPETEGIWITGFGVLF